jgi:hopanoid-associated phosphorylase
MKPLPHVPKTVAVTGLRREARLLSRPDIVTVAGGGNARALEQGIEDAIGAGANRVLSVGICGALSPSLGIGDCIVATEVVTRGGRYPVHGEWRSALLASLPNAKPGILAGSDAILADAAAKSRLEGATGAVAVDMESHIAAAIAERQQLPFAAVRVVSDLAGQSLPPAVSVAMLENGRIDVAAVLRSVAGNPGQIPALIRTAWDAERAFRALARCSHVLVV